MNIRQMLVNPNKYSIKCPYGMNATRIVVHNTANDASANNEVSYMINNNNQVSYHIAVDDVEAVQGLPLDRNGWHSGDGNGAGNRQGIAIEICYSKSGGDRFSRAEQNAAQVIAQLLKERGWGIGQVTKHQDYSNKYCPHRTLDMGWQRFLNMVQVALNGQPSPTPPPVEPVQPTPPPSSAISVGDTIRIRGLYIAKDVKVLYGYYQIRNDTLAGGMFDWVQNGIPEACEDITDANGNKRPDSDRVHIKTGDYFNFPGVFKAVSKATDRGVKFVKLDFNNNKNYQFWVVEERCYKV